jgi:tetratricopeptide (TPR) repeat protein
MTRTRTPSSFYLGATILAFFLLACGTHFDLYKRYRSQGTFLSQMLYLPSGKYLKPISFGYYTLLSDFIYLWSIQYYGDPGFHPRVEYLKHTYDIITELDPHYLDAYQTGALFMFYEGRNPKAGLDLLDQGLKNNPDQWILPLDAGFYCMMSLKNKEMAAEYFRKASKIPGAVTLAKRAEASMRFKMGDKLTAFSLWSQVYEEVEQASIKQIAFQHMHDLRVLMDLDILRKGIHTYRKQFKRNPLNLEQLLSHRFIPNLPADPEGSPYRYESRSGEVKYAQQLTLYKRFQ